MAKIAPADWPDRLQKKIDAIVQDFREKREIRQAFREARQERRREEELPKFLSSTSLSPQETLDSVSIRPVWREGLRFWDFTSQDLPAVPLSLVESLEELGEMVQNSPVNEAIIRMKVNIFIRSALRQAGYKRAHLQTERRLQINRYINTKMHTITGFADYAVWYGDDPADESTSIMIIETKQSKENGLYQGLSNVAMVHYLRIKAGRSNRTVYGVSADAIEWQFVSLAADRTV
ncbi:hypothetical protein P170DRAFT_421507 [Aspergillus steynii IBT 23096]|uniref:Uncharacterized protein n=1 Tax=Aspergillus steynii IBT 23096 TaxID=1392250 RepID=A0A2I2GPS2_9EURO|nr:uncharacterized protein P170DRAFT_421507 [Aspergillus steynii IBT 23096]PLB54869.1 hypothetical protein P170DRAFT_421507 [Aspergillus steynii IBT 23096]